MNTNLITNEKNRRRQCRSRSCVRSRKRPLKSATVTNSYEEEQCNHTPTTFEQHMHKQGINLLSSSEYYVFFSTLSTPLPICFKIRSKSIIDEWKVIKTMRTMANTPSNHNHSVKPIKYHPI